MQLGQFDLFCQVARVKSFSKAAKLLHISQPAISAQIHSMEEFYGIKLFERTPHGVNLTPAGSTLFEYAKRLLQIHEELERKLTIMADEKNQRLTIGASPTVGSHSLAYGIWSFKDKYPELSTNLVIDSPQDIMKRILDKELDLAIIECPIRNLKGLTVKTILTDELVAIVPNSKKWVGKNTVSLDELSNNRLILRENGSELHYILDEALKPLNLSYADLNPYTTVTNTNAIIAAVENGFGVSIGLRLTVQSELKHGSILAIPISQISSKVEYSLIYREQELSHVAKRFIRFITTPSEIEGIPT
jgi:molybdate transport repressor ModE-like protein